MAFMPLLNGGRNWRQRLLPDSHSKMFLAASDATPDGPFIPFWVVAGAKPLKFDWPSTRAAFIPLLNGGWKPKIRWWPPSVRFRDQSIRDSECLIIVG
jgi:hypothetical protein